MNEVTYDDDPYLVGLSRILVPADRLYEVFDVLRAKPGAMARMFGPVDAHDKPHYEMDISSYCLFKLGQKLIPVIFVCPELDFERNALLYSATAVRNPSITRVARIAAD
jgi:hypothetical protein